LQFLTQHAHRVQAERQIQTRPDIADYEMADKEFRLPLGQLKQ
jgi:hypothetical protein